jgi:Tfp pilus assembly protein PilF
MIVSAANPVRAVFIDRVSRWSVCASWAFFVVIVLSSVPAAAGEFQQWDVAAKFVALKPGQPDVAIFELADASRVEVPLAALSVANRKTIAGFAEGPPSAEKADREGVPDAQEADGNAAADLVAHAIDLLKLGNAQLAKQELQKASKADLSSGEADFVMATIYAIGARNYEKAVDHFSEVIIREPAHVAAIANLAVCELHAKQYSSAVGHFRRALELKPEGQAIADNMALAIQAAGAGRARMTEKVLADFNDLYRKALVDLKLSRLDPGASRALVFHCLDGRPVDPQSPTLLLDAVKRPQPPPPQEPVSRKLDEPPAHPSKASDAVSPQSQ